MQQLLHQQNWQWFALWMSSYDLDFIAPFSFPVSSSSSNSLQRKGSSSEQASISSGCSSWPLSIMFCVSNEVSFKKYKKGREQPIWFLGLSQYQAINSIFQWTDSSREETQFQGENGNSRILPVKYVTHLNYLISKHIINHPLVNNKNKLRKTAKPTVIYCRDWKFCPPPTWLQCYHRVLLMASL